MLQLEWPQRLTKSPSNSEMQLPEDLKLIEKTWNYTENQKNGHSSLGDQQAYYLQVFKNFTNHRKRTKRAVVLRRRPRPNILKYMDNRWNLPTIWKTRYVCFRYVLKISAIMYKSSNSQFFRPSTVILSGQETFDKSRLVMTILTSLVSQPSQLPYTLIFFSTSCFHCSRWKLLHFALAPIQYGKICSIRQI